MASLSLVMIDLDCCLVAAESFASIGLARGSPRFEK